MPAFFSRLPEAVGEVCQRSADRRGAKPPDPPAGRNRLLPGQGPPEAGSRARPGRFGQRPTAEGGAPGRAGRGLALAWSFPQERYTMLYLLRKSAPSFGRPSALRKVSRVLPDH